MVITVSLICKRVFSHKFEISREKLDELTIGLGKGGAIALLVYFGVKVVDQVERLDSMLSHQGAVREQ